VTIHDVPPVDLDGPPPAAPAARRPSRTFSILAGLVAAAVALGVAELLAGLNRAWRSPVLDVGDRLIDAAPAFVKEFAIDTFGTNDKNALIVGIVVVSLLLGAIFGMLARHWPSVPFVGFAAFGLIGIWAAAKDPLASAGTAAIAVTLGVLAGVLVVMVAVMVI